MDQVFISHSHTDGAAVERVVAALTAMGFKPWISTEQIGHGDVFTTRIYRAIASSRALVLIHTARAATRDWVKSEVRFALLNKVPIIVVQVDKVDPRGELALMLTPACPIVPLRWGQRARFATALAAAMQATERKQAPVIAILNAKGGVGKTVIATNVFLAMAAHEKVKANVLLVDLDPQHNLSQIILPEGQLDELQSNEQTLSAAFEPGRFAGHPSPTADYTLLSSDREYTPPTVSELRWYVPHDQVLGSFDIVCGDVSIGKYTLPHQSADRLQYCKERFSRFIADARLQYDVVVIDCNPSFSFLTMCALEVCTHTLSPVTPDVFAMRGLTAFKSMTEALYPTSLPQRVIVMNRVKRGSAASDVEQQIIDSPVYGPGLVRSARIADSLFMRPQVGDFAAANPLNALARFRGGNGAAELHAELDSVALEVAHRVGLVAS